MYTTEVKSILKKLKPFIRNSSVLPALGCLRIRSEKNRVIFDVTDLNHYVSYPLQNSPAEGLAAIVDFASFKEAIDGLSVGHFDLWSDNATLLVSTRDSTISLVNQDWDFPDTPALGDFRMSLSTYLLSQIVERVAPFNTLGMGNDDQRPSLQQVQIKVQYPGLIATATDGFKLARLQTEAVEHFLGEDQELLIPADKLDKVLALANGSRLNGLEMVRVFSETARGDICMAGFEFANGVRVSAVGPPRGVRFPDVNQIIPKDHEASFIFRVTDLQKALKAMDFIFKSQDKKKFRGRKFMLTVQPGQAMVRLEAQAEGNIAAREIRLVGMPAISQEIVMGISPDHLGVILSAAKGDEITFHTGPNRSQNGSLMDPIVLRVNGKPVWFAVLMPMSISD